MPNEPMFKIEPPTVEQIVQRVIDGAGYHKATVIPVEDVRRMLAAAIVAEHRWNVNLAETLEQYMRVSTKHLVFQQATDIEEVEKRLISPLFS